MCACKEVIQSSKLVIVDEQRQLKEQRGTGDRDSVKEHGSLYDTDVEGRASDAQRI